MTDKEFEMEGVRIALSLEYYGIHIEGVQEMDPFKDISNPIIAKYYFSVPESSTLEEDKLDEETNKLIKTSEGLILFAKKELCKLISLSCEAVLDDEEIEELKLGKTNYIKFFAKVRIGEVWNKEMANKKLKEFLVEIKVASGYSEV